MISPLIDRVFTSARGGSGGGGLTGAASLLLLAILVDSMNNIIHAFLDEHVLILLFTVPRLPRRSHAGIGVGVGVVLGLNRRLVVI